MLRVSVEGSTRNRMIRYLQQAHENHITLEINRVLESDVLDVWAVHPSNSDDVRNASRSLENGYKVALVMCLYEILEYFAEKFSNKEIQKRLDEVKEHADEISKTS